MGLLEGIEEIKEKIEFVWGLTKEMGDYDEIPETRIEDFSFRDDIPGLEGERVLVCGRPLEAEKTLDYQQGDNLFNASGDCSIVSCGNVLTMCGLEGISENLMLERAINKNLCDYGWGVDPMDAGAAHTVNDAKLIQSFGVDVDIFMASFEPETAIDAMAARFESGRAGLITVDAGYLWNEPEYVGSSHAVTLTGTVRDPESGELKGFTICDSGCDDACRYVSKADMAACYGPYGQSIFTAEPLRQ